MKNDIDKAIDFIKSLNDENLQGMIDRKENVVKLLCELSKYRKLRYGKKEKGS